MLCVCVYAHAHALYVGYSDVSLDVGTMMMIAFIIIKSSLVPLIEGLCAQIYFRFEISVVLLTSSSFIFCERKNMLKKNKKAVSIDFYL